METSDGYVNLQPEHDDFIELQTQESMLAPTDDGSEEYWEKRDVGFGHGLL